MKIMFKCRYVKGKKSVSHLKNLVNYIATREGVEKKSNYVDYIANRPNVEKVDTHGLFNSGNKPINLSEVQRIVANHKGNVWLPIISLTRDDAAATGYDNLEKWQILMSKLALKMAENFKIKPDNFHWYAAFHNESHHPHIHMVIYSDNPNEGYLNEAGIENMLIELRKRTYKGKPIKEVTVQKHLVAISAVLSDAKRNEIIPKNPARMVELPPAEKAVQLIPTDAEIKALMNALLDEPEHYRYYYFLAIYTGCRRGELCALKW